MTPVFDRLGAVVGWVLDDRILDRGGRHRAFIHGSAVYGYDSRYRGTFKRGFFRDRSGNAVAFVQGAAGGPLLPLTQLQAAGPTAAAAAAQAARSAGTATATSNSRVE
jgi:hypothetical protein